MTIDPKKSGASPSAPTWGNWSGNIVHEPPTDGANYYFRPTNLVELKSVLADAVTKRVTVRVSGQRHSQPPLVATPRCRGHFLRTATPIFVNLDLIGFVEPTKSSEYPAELLKFFAHVERKWVSLGRLPHNGKMFGFYDRPGPGFLYAAVQQEVLELHHQATH